MFGIYNSAGTGDRHSFRLKINGTNNVQASTAEAAASSVATSSTAFSLNTWFHVGGVYDITTGTDRAVFLNGGGKGTNTTNRTPSGLNRTSIGIQDNSAGNEPFPGLLAEACVWNTNLSDALMARIALGYHPASIQSANLLACWPLIGDYNPEKDIFGANDLTIVGSLAGEPSNHPNVIYRYRGRESTALRPGRGPTNRQFASRFWKGRPAYTLIFEAKDAAASLDLAVQQGLAVTGSLDMAVQAAATRAASLDMAVQQALTAAASLDLAVYTANVNTAQMDMAVQAAATALANLDMAIEMAVSSQSMMDVAVQIERSVAASLDMAVMQAIALATALDLAVQAPMLASASLDMFVDDGSPPPADENRSRGMIADVGRMMH